MGDFFRFRKATVNALDDVDAGNPKEPTTEEKLKALTERVTQIEKDIRVWPESDYMFSNLLSFYSFYIGGGDSRPKVGEGVRLLMQHLGLTFEAGAKTPDKLVKAKKSKKK